MSRKKRASRLNQDDILTAAQLLREARAAVAFTGAGISVPSGIPDFRSPGGLWSRYDPQKVASLQALRSAPEDVWAFMHEAHGMFSAASPNPAHTALADMERAGLLTGIITQNIDSLHQRAGSREVVEFHGSADRFHCMRCARPYEAVNLAALGGVGVPTCPSCGGVVRPDVVFFGEGIPSQPRRRAEALIAAADCILVIGTSGDVMPANTFPYRVKNAGGAVIEVNLGPTAYGALPDVRFDAPAQEVLPLLYDCAVS